ncbi:MAG: hypothetical protein Ta2B_30480 [Termitinemataceae bacterium]|nr:MAG: hypothetical protein Ta2B_30480 [Termitinemataceae bacterium]
MNMTKERINELKQQGIGTFLQEDKANIAYIPTILENLGRLPSDFDGSWMVDLLLNDKNVATRILALKNLGKLKNDNFLVLFEKIAKTDTDNVRREAVSAIGRLRKPNSKKILFEKLKDSDPKVVCQAIRGLLVFKGESDIDERLKKLINHQNEMVQQVIRKEYFTEKKSANIQYHTESFNYLKNVVVHGDTIETMKLLQDERGASFFHGFFKLIFCNAPIFCSLPAT